MSVAEVSKRITDCILQLATMSAEIVTRAKNRAESIANYRKKIAITIIGMRNGQTFKIDEVETIPNPPVSIVEKLAQGVCYKEKLEMETAEALYKSCISNIESVKAQLNGWQSINRHLSEV